MKDQKSVNVYSTREGFLTILATLYQIFVQTRHQTATSVRLLYVTYQKIELITNRSRLQVNKKQCKMSEISESVVL